MNVVNAWKNKSYQHRVYDYLTSQRHLILSGLFFWICSSVKMTISRLKGARIKAIRMKA